MRFSSILISKIFPTLLVVLAFTLNANSTICVFTNEGNDSLWSNPENWNTGFVPGTNDDAQVGENKVLVDVNIAVNSLSMTKGSVVSFTHAEKAIIGTLSLAGGILESSSEILINDYFNWTANATIKQSTSLVLTSNCITNIAGKEDRKLFGQLINHGILSFKEGSLTMESESSITNNGEFFVNGPSQILSNNGGVFENNGVFFHLSNSMTEIHPDFINNATGIIKGSGALNFGKFQNKGTVAPGLSIGNLDLSQNTTNDEVLKIALNETKPNRLITE